MKRTHALSSTIGETLAPLVASVVFACGGCKEPTAFSLTRTPGTKAEGVDTAPSALQTSHRRGENEREAPRGSPARSAKQEPERPIGVTSVDVPGDLPAFVLPGKKSTSRKMVFLHGRCSHALGYVQAFQSAAAERGTLVAPQGDQACGASPLRRWTLDIEKIDERIEAAFRAAGVTEALTEVTVMGYSEGSSRAEALAARFPERYTRVVLMGAPSTPSAARLHKVRSAVMIAGERDRRDQMKEGARALDAIGIPALFLIMPGAAHGQITEGERIMDEAFDWLFADG